MTNTATATLNPMAIFAPAERLLPPTCFTCAYATLVAAPVFGSTWKV